jgi:NDP-sugar pyrophosphorylase family protein
VDGERVISLVEKPTTRHFINAGIYVLAPQLLATIAPGQRLDMTDLADRILERGGTLSAFPIHEYWLDIGHLEDFERAQADFAEHFH